MRIYQLTQLGDYISRTPVSNPSDAQKALYFMKARQGKASDEQLQEFRGIGITTMQKLVNNKLVTVISA